MDEEDSNNPMNNSRSLIRLSIAATLVVAVAGIAWGLVANARIIIFDGIYSLISIGLSLLSLWAIGFSKKEDNLTEKQYPFGRYVVEPLVLLVKSLVMLVVVMAAVGYAIQDLLSGGRMVELEHTLAYALISTVFSLTVFGVLRAKGRACHSELLNLEAEEWKLDAFISIGTLAGFSAALLMGRVGWGRLVPYVDPLLLLMIATFFVRTPAKAVWAGIRELMRMAPDEGMQHRIDQVVQEVQRKYRLEASYCRVSIVGQTIFLEIDFVTGEDALVKTVQDTDRIREEISAAVLSLPYEPWLTVSFTGNKKWAV